MKLPVPFPHIVLMDDHGIVAALLKRLATETTEFFYGKSYPVFKSLYDRYYTDCSDIVEFINDIYLTVMTPNETDGKCKLQTFTFRCQLKNWIAVVALRYCYNAFNCKISTESLELSDSFFQTSSSIGLDSSRIDGMDVDKILNMMPNDRYRQLIRYRYVEEKSHEQTAALLGMTMDNYYNKHRLAKAQYLAVYCKEMRI